MLKQEVFEEIRSLLREPQADLGATPWHYSDMDLIAQIRSAMRFLRLVGLTSLTDITLDADSDFNDEPVEADGMLIAYRVAARLLSGDLIRKLTAGELGAYWRSGPDIIDTKDASKVFVQAARSYDGEFNRLLTIRLAAVGADTNAAQSVFGNQTAATDGET